MPWDSCVGCSERVLGGAGLGPLGTHLCFLYTLLCTNMCEAHISWKQSRRWGSFERAGQGRSKQGSRDLNSNPAPAGSSGVWIAPQNCSHLGATAGLLDSQSTAWPAVRGNLWTDRFPSAKGNFPETDRLGVATGQLSQQWGMGVPAERGLGRLRPVLLPSAPCPEGGESTSLQFHRLFCP